MFRLAFHTAQRTDPSPQPSCALPGPTCRRTTFPLTSALAGGPGQDFHSRRSTVRLLDSGNSSNCSSRQAWRFSTQDCKRQDFVVPRKPCWLSRFRGRRTRCSDESRTRIAYTVSGVRHRRERGVFRFSQRLNRAQPSIRSNRAPRRPEDICAGAKSAATGKPIPPGASVSVARDRRRAAPTSS